MNLLSVRCAAVTVAISGFAAGTALFGVGTAAADPLADIGPLLSSSCSFNQVDTALHKIAPEAAAKLDADPAQKELLRQAFNQPVVQRKAAFQQLIAHQQQMGVKASSDPTFGAKLNQVIGTCHQY